MLRLFDKKGVPEMGNEKIVQEDLIDGFDTAYSHRYGWIRTLVEGGGFGRQPGASSRSISVDRNGDRRRCGCF